MEREFKKKTNKVKIDEDQQKISSLPKNFEEFRFNEQYFFTKKIVKQICDSILIYFQYDKERISKKVCFIGAPTLCLYLEKHHGISTTLLDVDERFSKLKQYKYFDILDPKKIEGFDFEFVLMDPPFFAITLKQLSNAIKVVTNFNYNCAVVVGFRYYDEKELLFEFREFKLRRSKFKLEYVTIHPNKWGNYRFYANKNVHLISIPKDLKRVKKGDKKKNRLLSMK